MEFEYRLINMPVERLFSPKLKLQGQNVSVPLKFIPFKLSNKKISSDLDVIKFLDYFTQYPDFFDNTSDFKEYLKSNNLYLSLDKFPDKDLKNRITNKIINALKYPFALQRMLQSLVASDTIFTFHLPYLNEAALDMEASFLLIEHGYYKQSLQSLRNVIEVTLAHAYFGLKGLDFYDIASTIDFRMPPLRGGNESLIRFLKENGIIDDNLESRIISLYKNLSGAVHSEIRTLNSFNNKSSIDQWYNIFVKTGELNLRLILRMINVGM